VDRLNSVMVRLSFVWLLAGVVVGGAMLIDRALPGQWRLWLQPSHVHMLVVGWFLQFALGIAYWLLPRKRTPSQPLGYNERLAFAAVAGLNLGLILRVIGETTERAGHESDLTLAILSGSAVLQIAAIATFVVQLWPRVQIRSRTKSQPAGTGAKQQEKA
jgi:hypothetical protein